MRRGSIQDRQYEYLRLVSLEGLKLFSVGKYNGQVVFIGS